VPGFPDQTLTNRKVKNCLKVGSWERGSPLPPFRQKRQRTAALPFRLVSATRLVKTLASYRDLASILAAYATLMTSASQQHLKLSPL
jgi:hypothetical protein